MAKSRYGMPASLERWTPKRAANFARTRIDRIKLALMEIAVAYDDVDSSIGWACDRVRDDLDSEGGLVEHINEALAEGSAP